MGTWTLALSVNLVQQICQKLFQNDKRNTYWETDENFSHRKQAKEEKKTLLDQSMAVTWGRNRNVWFYRVVYFKKQKNMLLYDFFKASTHANELTRCPHTRDHQNSCKPIPISATACSCVIAANSFSHSLRSTAHITMFRSSAVSDTRREWFIYLK